ncbi:hypothetical protein TH61_16115 [Rufibacter sp. DG15C]|uniref:hypothetical protein n=1 Tax=Rufibacter sp. DG15C TaxID=1379909 RepID=UPI00078ED941|nr:hypothetical protein [Rufibacter sp. DG15C]AMM52407.1 hypothetical protein TH61_16115 [Rufibacter sp. DG15C]
MIRHKLFYPFIVVLGLLGFSACQDSPDFSNTPNIEYRGNTHYSFKDQNGLVWDTIQHVIRFTDGDGNIGLSDKDDPALNDYFSELYLKRNGIFYQIYAGITPRPTTPIRYYGRIPVLNTSDRIEPLEGDIKYGIRLRKGTPFDYFVNNDYMRDALKTGDTVRFDFYIKDRTGNSSNKVESPEIILKFDK